MSMPDLDRHLQRLLSALRGRCGGSETVPPGWLLCDPAGEAAGELLSRFEATAAEAGSLVLAGSWRSGLLRPYGGFLEAVEALAERLLHDEPMLLKHYGGTLMTLAPGWGDVPLIRESQGEDGGRGKHSSRSGLADFVLRGNRRTLHEFFQKRNVSPQKIASLVHFMLDGASALARRSGAPVLLLLDDVHRADTQTRKTLQLVVRYAAAERAPLLVCAGATAGLDAGWSNLTGEPVEPAEWHLVDLVSDDDGVHDDAAHLGAELRAAARWILQAAAIFAAPFSSADLSALAGEKESAAVEPALATLLGRCILHRTGNERFTFVRARTRQAVLDGLDEETRRAWHGLLIDHERVRDPFIAAYHAEATGDRAAVHRTSLAAMEQAWAASSYESAIAYAHRALETGDGSIDRNLLLAMLCYEAERYEDAERYLLAALDDQRPREIDGSQIEYFLGYNAVFGLSDFERGHTILKSVLKSYEQQGREREAGYVRNSMAFALYRSGKLDEALDIENVTLDLKEQVRRSDDFLLSILHLNLGRLYRTIGASDRAIQLFREGIELSPHLQLLFHSCLGHLHYRREEYTSALTTYHHCFDIVRGWPLANLHDQVLLAMLGSAPRLPKDRTTRGQEVLYYLYTNLALACRRLGLDARVQAYLDGLRCQRVSLGDSAIRAFEAVIASTEPVSLGRGSSRTERFVSESDATLAQCSETLQEIAGAGDLIAATADALASGRAVAWLRPRTLGAEVQILDSLVLCDPRFAELSGRVSKEIGGSSSRARSALVLPDALDLFSGGLEPLPLVLQESIVRPEHRDKLAGLAPIRSTVQVLSAAFDGPLFNLLEETRRRGGTGVLSATPFHLRAKSLVVEPEKAISSFLTSSIDLLVLDDRLIEKRHGAEAVENLLPLYPRRSRRAILLDSRGSTDANTFLVRVIGPWSLHAPAEFVRLRKEMRPVIDLCDGRLSVEEICRSLGRDAEPQPDRWRRVSGFLRQLWNYGILDFDHRADDQTRTTAEPLEQTGRAAATLSH